MATLLSKEWLEELHKEYLRGKSREAAIRRAEDAWLKEQAVLQDVIAALRAELSPRYEIGKPLGVGGVGVVLQVYDTNLEVSRALKFARPTGGRESAFAKIISSEISRLREAVHPNIIAMFQQGGVNASGHVFPYYVMEFILGAQDAAEYFESFADSADVLSILSQIFHGLAHLHGTGILHGDVKLENVLIGEGGRAVICDLGSARRISDGGAEISLVFTRPFAHPTLIAMASAGSDSDSNRVRVDKFPRRNLQLQFDLFALGRNLTRLVDLCERNGSLLREPYIRRYLKLMACRLLDGRNSDEECTLGLPKAAFVEIKYQSIKDVVLDLKKLTGEYNIIAANPELDEHSEQRIQTSSLSPTPFTARLADTISHPMMRRLAGVPQLGFISLVYPTATHSRFEHVLGTFTNAVRYCNALYHDHLNPLFRQLMTESDISALLLAALFHDLGQYPLAHDFQDAEEKMFEHEEIACGILECRYGGENARNFAAMIKEKWHIEPGRIAAIIRTDPRNLDHPIKDRILHTIISGPIDADKLDYLVRDSVNLHVPFGMAIDFERLLQCLTVVYKNQAGKVYAALGLHEKGRVAAETVAFARYAMFGSVYWHHTCRAGKAMLHRAIWEGLPERSQRVASKTYRDEFIQRVLHPDSLGGEQEDFFETQITFPGLSQVQPPDLKMLEWMATRTSNSGARLLEMLAGRELFRRILVLSKARSNRVWESLIKFRRHANPKTLVEFQNDFQKRVIDFLISVDREDMRYPDSSAAGDEATDRVIQAQEEGNILLLVDIPTERSGSRIPLEYLPEADYRDILQEWGQPIALEDSLIWQNLHDSFLEAVGKVRVFSDPNFRDTFEARLKKTSLTEMVEASVGLFA